MASHYNIGKVVQNIYEGENYVIIDFADGTSIQIDAILIIDRDAAYASLDIGDIE